MKRIIILVVFILGFNLSYSQISREKAYEIVKESVLGNNWNDYEILLMKSTLSANSVISAIDTSIVSPNYQSWFFFIDMDPSAEWMHSCKYVFISVYNGQFTSINMIVPPTCYASMEKLNSVIPVMETSPEYLFDIPTPKNNYSSSNEYAVIISGGADSSLNHERYWNHCAALYKTLVNIYHYDKSRIFVVFADGTNNGIDRHRLNNSYDSSPLDFDNDGIADIQYAATRSNISLVFNTLQQNVTSEDNVFVFVTDHGGRRDSIATITLWHESGLSTSEFASEINKINHAKTINLCLVQCCSGGFISALSGPNRVITTSCKLTESAHSSYPYHYR